MIAPDRVPIVLQQASSDCGVACLSSVIRFFRWASDLGAIKGFERYGYSGNYCIGLDGVS
ncbi:cysteine peptidase family C39 domain-containing protein [Algoriphagus boritolerans]|uniref:cysteine peptidase family C39 domain-containing protein n=1 Tax=Algoriphagus boritolerans TaxID=308111 RepID=UPI000AE2F0BC